MWLIVIKRVLMASVMVPISVHVIQDIFLMIPHSTYVSPIALKVVLMVSVLHQTFVCANMVMSRPVLREDSNVPLFKEVINKNTKI